MLIFRRHKKVCIYTSELSHILSTFFLEYLLTVPSLWLNICITKLLTNVSAKSHKKEVRVCKKM
jgi:hypothetical protein